MATNSQRTTKQSQTRDQVFDLIEQIGVGRAIPSERQLSQDFGVSRLTVRAAIDELAREGYLVRRRGSGTFVREPKIAQELTMTSFSEEMRRRGMRPGSRTLSLDVKHAGAYLGRCLHVSPSERIVVAERLRPGLTRKDFDNTSFYDLLTERYGIEIVGGVQTIEPTVTNEEESEALEVPLHSPAFLFERTTRSQTGEIVEFVRSIYRGDRYRLVTELNRRERGGAAPVFQPRDGRGPR